MRKFISALLSISVSMLVALLLLEAVLRFFPVHGGAFLEAVDEKAPYAHMIPDRDATYSVGPAMARALPHRTNNAGFVSIVPFVPDDTRPLLAVIGDSYVEALMVPDGAALQDHLRRALQPDYRVYGMGISGAAPPQYLMWGKQAVEEFGARYVVFVMVSTDFDETLLKYRARSGFHYLDGDLTQCELNMVRLDHTPTGFRPIIKHSALMRYLVFNLGLLETPAVNRLISFILSRPQPSDEGGTIASVPADEGNVETTEDQRTRDSRCATTWVLRNASEVVGLPRDRIIFLLDGGRLFGKDVTTPAATSYFGIMRQHFKSEAGRLGYPIIDLADAFEAARAAGEGPFSPPRDSHWNAEAHALVAESFLALWPDLEAGKPALSD